MKSLAKFLSFLTLILVFFPAGAQIQNAVQWTTYHKPTDNLKVGDVVTLYFEGKIDEGFHVYSAEAPEGWPQLASFFDLDEETKGIEVMGKLQEDGHAETAYDDIFETNITIYHDKIVFKQAVKITAENPHIASYVTYQVCDISQCVPGDIDYELDLKTVSATPTPVETEPKDPQPAEGDKTPASQADNKVEASNPIQTPAPASPVFVPEVSTENGETNDFTAKTENEGQTIEITPEDNPEPEPTTPADSSPPQEETLQKEGKSMLSIILEGLIFGFASLLTPCIFPLIPLTVSFFTKQSKTRAEGIQNALVYGLSIIFIFTFLGLLVSIIFGGDVLRQVAVNPWFNFFIFALIFIFALSFLGMFDITLPSSWSTALSVKSEKGGFAGIFLMALVLVIVSFSCVGPLVATNLFEAAQGKSYLGPTVGMLSFSSALAIPFMVFAAFPGLMNNLPKSGGWLNSVKVVLGFIELALCLVYFSRADLVLQTGWLDREIFLGAWIVIFFLLGLYLLGKLQLPHDSPLDRISVPRLLLAISSFWFAIYLVPGLWGAQLPMLGGYLPPNGKDIGVRVVGGEHGTGGQILASSENEICNYPDKVSGYLAQYSHEGFCAFYDLDQGLEYAKAENKPIFLDFTGITCANCRLLESTAWVDPVVKQMITEEYVLISLYTDDRTKLDKVYKRPNGDKVRTVGDKWIGYEIDNYTSNAQPFYVLLDHDKSSLVPPKGFANPPVDVMEYQEFFRSGLDEFNKRKRLTTR